MNDIIVFKNGKPPFQKSPLWRAFLERCVFGDRFYPLRDRSLWGGSLDFWENKRGISRN